MGTTFPLPKIPRFWASRDTNSQPSSAAWSRPAQLDLPLTNIEAHQALAIVAATRSAGGRIGPTDYEQLLLACLEQDQMLAVARLFEEAAQDGIRLSMLSEQSQTILQPFLPPEVEQTQDNDSDTMYLSDQEYSQQIYNDPLPMLWVRANKKGIDVDCTGPSREDAIADGRAAAVSKNSIVVFRGIGLNWPALREWKLERLSHFFLRGLVRIAPGPAVAVCRERHPDIQSGRTIPTSRAIFMNVSEFADRLRVGRRGRRAVLYGQDERCYLQALAPYEMMRQIDFSFFTSEDKINKDMPLTLGRLWVSAPGTVSPLHFDATDSYLCQIRGRKRILLWPAKVLQELNPYPSDHVQARRLQVDITGARGPTDERVLNAASEAIEVILEPGDVVFFPAEWAHHTEALPTIDSEGLVEPSISIAFRTDGQYLL